MQVWVGKIYVGIVRMLVVIMYKGWDTSCTPYQINFLWLTKKEKQESWGCLIFFTGGKAKSKLKKNNHIDN